MITHLVCFKTTSCHFVHVLYKIRPQGSHYMHVCNKVLTSFFFNSQLRGGLDGLNEITCKEFLNPVKHGANWRNNEDFCVISPMLCSWW